MPVSYPRAMPAIGFATIQFEPDFQTVTAPERGGRLVSVEIGPARWVGKWRTSTLTPAQFQAWRAWIASLRDSTRLFYGGDRLCRLPFAYRRTGLPGGFTTGNASSWSVNAAREALTLNGLPAGFVITEGDYVGFSWTSTKRALVRSLETVTASAGGVATFDVSPSVPALVPGGAVATLLDPVCLMRLIPRQAELEAEFRTTGSLTFQAVQHLEP